LMRKSDRDVFARLGWPVVVDWWGLPEPVRELLVLVGTYAGIGLTVVALTE
jgi:hypothetical protein